MSKITFQYIATEDNVSIIPILENIINFDSDLIANNIIVLYENEELKNNDNYSLDIKNKQISLIGWSLNEGEEIDYTIEIQNN
jgi:hypothetical protein